MFITRSMSIANVIRNANFSKTVRYISLFRAMTYAEILHTVPHNLNLVLKKVSRTWRSSWFVSELTDKSIESTSL
jgi:hypothetical protein